MRLNLGCGDHYAPGWTNVDAVITDVVRPDVVLDVTSDTLSLLTFQDVQHMYAGHVLEHIPHDDVEGVLRRWREWLTLDGELVVVGPDCDRGEAMLRAGQMHPDEYELLLHGGNRWPGDTHLWRATESETIILAERAGWRCQAVPVGSLFGTIYPLVSGVTWQFALRCRRDDYEKA